MSQIFDEDLLKSEIPKLPSCWKTIEIQYFLGFVKKDALKQKFRNFLQTLKILYFLYFI